MRNNEARIIKATSRELSYIMLGGVTIQYILICTSVSTGGVTIQYILICTSVNTGGVTIQYILICTSVSHCLRISIFLYRPFSRTWCDGGGGHGHLP